MSSPNRALRRRRTVLAGAAGTLLLGGGAWLQVSGAGAEPVTRDVPAACMLGANRVDVTIPLTVDDKIDPVPQGGKETVEIKTDLPQLPIEVTVNKLVVTIPIPAEIASVDMVTFTGGNMKGSSSLSGSSLVLTFTGPQSSSQLELPTVSVDQTVKDAIAPATIEWKTFSQAVADTNYGTATCTPNDPAMVINTTEVTAGDTPTTTPGESTTTTPGETTTTPPTTEPGTPTTEPGHDGDVGVNAEVGVEIGTPASTPPLPGGLPVPVPGGLPVPVPGGLPVPVPSGGGGGGTPPVAGLPPAPALPPAPKPPTVPAPTLPAPPALPKPTLPAPTLPKPTLPAPTLPAPTLPPAPVPVPTLPGGAGGSIGVDIETQIELWLPLI
jgi:hypothetical protein